MKLYLAGKMRGVPELNHPAFDEAARQLREAGRLVFSPAEHDRAYRKLYGKDVDVRTAMRDDLAWICDNADGIALLPLWEGSLGVTVELCLAKALDIDVKRWEEWL